MLLTFALVVLGCAMGVLFSKEIAAQLKTLFEWPLMTLLVPMCVLTFVLVRYEPECAMALCFIQRHMDELLHGAMQWIPFKKGAWVFVSVILLVGFPMLVSEGVAYGYEKRHLKPFPYRMGISGLLWLFIVMLYVIPLGV